MKIQLLQPHPKFQAPTQGFVWPPRNSELGENRGVEQDFLYWILNQDVLASSPYEANWGYCPIFHNRWYLGNNDEDGHWGGSTADRAALQEEIDRLWESWQGPWFTISEADIRVLQPYLDFHDMVVFCGSRRDEGTGIDIPLLSAPHPIQRQSKQYLASFLGHMQTDGTRIRMNEELEGRADCRIEHANHGPDEFAKNILQSYIALAPRGQGMQSFRFYEAMQLGTVPLYLSDVDCRPFQKWIDWDSCSLYRNTTDGLGDYLDSLDKQELLDMGQQSFIVHRDQIGYGQWCRYVVKELKCLLQYG